MRIGKALARGSLGCVLVAACGKTIPVESHSACPCAPGWSCCDAVCVYGACAADASPPVDASGGDGADGAPPMTFAPLDPMTSALTVLGTNWYVFSDRTCPFSCPPLYVAGATGTLSPQENTNFLPSTAGDGPTIEGRIWPYREASGGGESHWGVGFGFDLLDAPGPSPAAACAPGWCTGTLEDAGPGATGDAGSGAMPPEDAGTNAQWQCVDGTYSAQTASYDASAHAGLSFWVRAPDLTPADSLYVQLFVSDKQTSPSGGVCNPCIIGGLGACNDDFGAVLQPLTSSWMQQTVLFSQLGQAGWSGITGPLDLTTLGHVNFGVQVQLNGDPLPPFRLQVAYLQWVDE